MIGTLLERAFIRHVYTFFHSQSSRRSQLDNTFEVIVCKFHGVIQVSGFVDCSTVSLCLF